MQNSGLGGTPSHGSLMDIHGRDLSRSDYGWMHVDYVVLAQSA